MTEPFVPLTAPSEAQRAQAFERFTIICPALEDRVSQAQAARGNCAERPNENTELRAIASNFQRNYHELKKWLVSALLEGWHATSACYG